MKAKPFSIDQTFRWVTWAHLTAVLNLFTVTGGVLAAFLMYLWLRRRSPLAAFHALQALFMQLALWVGGALLALGLAVLANRVLQVSGFGVILWPRAFLAALIPIGSIVYGAYGAWAARSDLEFKYYKVGNAAMRIIQAQEAKR